MDGKQHTYCLAHAHQEGYCAGCGCWVGRAELSSVGLCEICAQDYGVTADLLTKRNAALEDALDEAQAWIIEKEKRIANQENCISQQKEVIDDLHAQLRECEGASVETVLRCPNCDAGEAEIRSVHNIRWHGVTEIMSCDGCGFTAPVTDFRRAPVPTVPKGALDAAQARIIELEAQLKARWVDAPWDEASVRPQTGLPVTCPECGASADHDEGWFYWDAGKNGHPTMERIRCPECGLDTGEEDDLDFSLFHSFYESEDA
jgi:predicted RNA-binding Zn-ribbon protein involved in translation (DUF1610 family)